MDGSPPPPLVRWAREEDAPAIAAVVVDALSDKYGPALGRAEVCFDVRSDVALEVLEEIHRGTMPRHGQ